MFVCNGAVTPGPSRECDITVFVKGRPNSARQSRDSTVAARRVQSVTVPSSRVSHECRSPGLRSPPFKNAQLEGCGDLSHRHAFQGRNAGYTPVRSVSTSDFQSEVGEVFGENWRRTSGEFWKEIFELLFTHEKGTQTQTFESGYFPFG